MSNILFKEESYKIMGILFDVHSSLGAGFSELVYKDALKYEFKLNYIILEIKSVECFNKSHYN